MTTVLYVSPHLDDVALSCAGRLIRDVDAGARVVVATLFTDGAGRGYRARRREDRTALAAAGAESLHLGLLDAPDRIGRRRRFGALLLGEPPTQDDIDGAMRALAPVIDRLAPDRSWWPLAVGGHVDHRVAQACHPLGGREARFYLDRPYDFVPALRAWRRLELEGGDLDDPPGPARIERELGDAGVFDRLFADGERAECVGELARRLAATTPVTGRALVIEDVRLPYTLLAAAARLVAGYRSQLRWLVAPGARVEQLYRRLAGSADGWSEPAAQIVARP